jgi:Zn finger protein HypA/HybF involved in hydrogenase expression
MGDLYSALAQSHPKIARGRVWCHTCGNSVTVQPAECFLSGWPLCCGETMSIDSPEERKSLAPEKEGG